MAAMRLVIVESPYAGDVEANTAYARAAMADCLARGEAPFASHLLYTQPGVLSDEDPDERRLGIEAGLAWGSVAAATVVYVDRGLSFGMRLGIERARLASRPIEVRVIDGCRHPIRRVAGISVNTVEPCGVCPTCVAFTAAREFAEASGTGPDLFELANGGTDADWHAATGKCGGCGEDCGCGGCVGAYCMKCPNRRNQGFGCPPDCDGAHVTSPDTTTNPTEKEAI